MENILLKLFVPDTNVILEGTAELKEAFKNPDSVPALCHLILTSTNTQIRQYAAILLRGRYSKTSNWTKLPANIRAEFKAVMLQALVNESEKLVKNSIAQLIGVIIKHELPSNGWPEILDFIRESITNEDLANKELGTYTLSIITEATPSVYVSHARSMVLLLAQTLSSLQDLRNPTAYYVLKTLQHLIPVIEQDQVIVNAYIHTLPLVMDTIQALTTSDEAKAIQCFELLDELCENVNAVISPHMKALICMCLAIATNNSLNDELKVKAIGFIGWLVKTKKKALIKHKLVEPITDVLFTLMSAHSDNDDDDDINEDTDHNTPIMVATQTLDLLAMHLPPEKLIPYLLCRYIEPGLKGTDLYAKKAAYMAMAVLAEGCSDYIRSKYLESFLRYICEGITHTAPVVVNAALFALGQFSEHLQPEISQYASDLLPVLFEYLNFVCTYTKQNEKELSVSRMFYALEMFCEHLNESLLPYLPTLMERVFAILNANTSTHVKELALSTISSAACACKEHMLPYFERIIVILNGYLIDNQADETMCLKIQAVDTLAMIAETIGEQHFTPLAEKSLNLGLNLLKEKDDPDLRQSVYSLFVSISIVMRKNMARALPEIVEYMITSIRSSDGIVMHYKNEENNDFLIYEDLSEDEDENAEEDIENSDNEDEDDDIAGYSVENSYMDEKEEAILALKEIAKYTEEMFIPYLEMAFEEIYKLIIYPQENMRKASIDALVQFCISFSKINTNDGRVTLLRALSVLVPKLAELIRLDDERKVAIRGLEAYVDILKEIKSDVIVGDGHKDAIINCVIEVIAGKTKCQDQEEVEGIETEAEQEELLIECAGEVLTAFGNVIPPDDFAFYFQKVLPLLTRRLKKNKSEEQRSFAIGTISECFAGLNNKVAMFVPELLPIFLRMINDPNASVRNNAIFGIGEMALHGKEAVYSHYPAILEVLSNLIAKESHAGARDNVVGAIARLIIVNYSILPLEQIFPIFVEQLPLKDDFMENKAVFRSILVLYETGHAVLQAYIGTLLNIAIKVLREDTTGSDEAKNLIMEFIKSVQRDFPNEWNASAHQQVAI